MQADTEEGSSYESARVSQNLHTLNVTAREFNVSPVSSSLYQKK